MTTEEKHRLKEMDYRIIKKYGRRLVVFENGTIMRLGFTDTKGAKRKTKILKSKDNGTGYTQVTIKTDKKYYNFYIHRLVAEAFLDDYSDKLQVDHINGIKSHNRLENLRLLTSKMNTRLFQNPRKGSSSKYRGVNLNGGKWRAQIGKRVLGYFTDEVDAALAYDEAALELGYNPESLNVTQFQLEISA